MTDETQTRQAVQNWLDLMWGERDWARVPEFVGPKFTRHEPSGTRTVTPEAYAEELAELPSRSVETSFDIFADGNIAFVIWTASAEGVGDLSSVQAYRVADGKLVETWYSAIVPVRWPLSPSSVDGGDPEAGRSLLSRWYDEMYDDQRFTELGPELSGATFIRHEANGTFSETAEEHAERLATGYAALKAIGGVGGSTPDRRLFAGADKAGVIGFDRKRRRAWVQAWRIADGKFVESWWPGFASDVDW